MFIYSYSFAASSRCSEAALVGTTCHMPFDVVLTTYQSAHSLGGDRLERYGRSGTLGCAMALLRESGAEAKQHQACATTAD